MKPPASHHPGIVTMALAGITMMVLLLSAPETLREDFNRGGFYVFSHAFIEDIPKQLSGRGRFRFVLQPLIAVLLGIRSGLADARAGRPAYLWGLLFKPELRCELLRSGFLTTANLLLMGVLLESIFQWVILGKSYPGAALVVGSLLVAAPYVLARALTNRCFPLRRSQ